MSAVESEAKIILPVNKSHVTASDIAYYKPHWRLGEGFSVALLALLGCLPWYFVITGAVLYSPSFIFITGLFLLASGYFLYANVTRKRIGNMRAILNNGILTVVGSKRKFDERNNICLADVTSMTYIEEQGIYVLQDDNNKRLYIPERIAAERSLRRVLMELLDSDRVTDAPGNRSAKREIDIYNELDPLTGV